MDSGRLQAALAPETTRIRRETFHRAAARNSTTESQSHGELQTN